LAQEIKNVNAERLPVRGASPTGEGYRQVRQVRQEMKYEESLAQLHKEASPVGGASRREELVVRHRSFRRYLEHRQNTPISIQFLWRGWLKLHDKSQGCNDLEILNGKS